MRAKLFLSSLGLVLTLNAYALPGFVKAMKQAHPGEKVSCKSCHEPQLGERPEGSSVTYQGRLYYEELLWRDGQRKLPALPGLLGLRSVDFIVFGDTRSNDLVHRDLVKEICAEKAANVFHTGDVVANGSARLWKKALALEDCLIKAKNLHTACGNHEGSGCVNNVFKDALGNNERYYTVDTGDFTAIVLDSENQDSPQLDWLSKIPSGRRYIPFFHHVPYPTMSAHEADSGVRSRFVPQFKRLGVKISFNGHNHGYDRAVVDGITFVTAGGGGAPLYPCGPFESYSKACVSNYHYVRCASSATEVDCEAKLHRTGQIIDTFHVDL